MQRKPLTKFNIHLWLKKKNPPKSRNRSNISSVQFSCSVVSNSLRPHELQHTRPPCPSPTPGVHSNSRLSSRWCHPAISSSVVPFSSCPQSLPASKSFPVSQLFMWGGQSTGVSALAPFLPKNTQGPISFRMDWLDLLAAQGTLKSLLQHHSSWDWVISGSWWWTGKTWHAAVHGVTKSGTRLSG